MKSDWKECKIGDIGTVVGGATPSTKESQNYTNGTIAWITPKDLSNFRGRYISRGERNITEVGLKSCSAQLLPAGSVLFSSRAPIGYVAIAQNELCTNQGFKSVIPNSGTDSRFLYYLLKHNKDEIENSGNGTTFYEVSGSAMKNVVVRVPRTLDTQRKIASVLSSLDDKIELNDRINANLEEQAKAIFKSWFVDFEPFGGTMPEDWKRVPFEIIANVSSGKLPPMTSPKLTEEARIPFVGSTSILGYTNAANRNEKILTVGKVGARLGVVQRFNKPCWVSNNAFVVTSPYHEYVYQILKRTDYMAMNRGSAQPYISYDDLNKKEVLLPDKQTLCRYESVVGTLMKRHEGNATENEKLSSLRDALLPRLLSGELDVPELNI